MISETNEPSNMRVDTEKTNVCSDEYDILELNEQKMIKKSMGPQVADLIRKDFQNIVDGEY